MATSLGTNAVIVKRVHCTMLLWKSGEHYPRIITKYSSFTSPMSCFIYRRDDGHWQYVFVCAFAYLYFHLSESVA